jgi:DNA polymerase epsilon subunit 2
LLFLDAFKKLAELICEFDNIRLTSHFVFVPGMQDPAVGNILPRFVLSFILLITQFSISRPPLPANLVQPLRTKLPKCHFATNPCRLRYCTQEIVVFRFVFCYILQLFVLFFILQ